MNLKGSETTLAAKRISLSDSLLPYIVPEAPGQWLRAVTASLGIAVEGESRQDGEEEHFDLLPSKLPRPFDLYSDYSGETVLGEIGEDGGSLRRLRGAKEDDESQSTELVLPTGPRLGLMMAAICLCVSLVSRPTPGILGLFNLPGRKLLDCLGFYDFV